MIDKIYHKHINTRIHFKNDNALVKTLHSFPTARRTKNVVGYNGENENFGSFGYIKPINRSATISLPNKYKYKINVSQKLKIPFVTKIKLLNYATEKSFSSFDRTQLIRNFFFFQKNTRANYYIEPVDIHDSMWYLSSHYHVSYIRKFFHKWKFHHVKIND